jgi:hypothetical protein
MVAGLNIETAMSCRPLVVATKWGAIALTLLASVFFSGCRPYLTCVEPTGGLRRMTWSEVIPDLDGRDLRRVRLAATADDVMTGLALTGTVASGIAGAVLAFQEGFSPAPVAALGAEAAVVMAWLLLEPILFDHMDRALNAAVHTKLPTCSTCRTPVMLRVPSDHVEGCCSH